MEDNMKRCKTKSFLLTFTIAIAIFAATFNAYAAEVTVSLPTFDVTMNGVKIANEHRQYPFIVYKDITYFPMTYFDSRFLGLATEWDNGKGLEIYKTTETTNYEPYTQNWKNSSKYTASIPNYKIVVNGKSINNSTETYPLLTFRNVTYFPLTWRFAVEEFGWKYSFTNKDGLIIDSTPETIQADPSDNPWPLTYDRTFKVGDDVVKVQLKSYRIAYSSKLYISINGEEQRQLGDDKYVYGVTTYEDVNNNAIGMKSNYFMELKDGWLYINAFNYLEEPSSRIYKVNINTGETVPVSESDNLNYYKISSYLQNECINVFSPYYELLDFIISDYTETIADGNVEAIFNYTVIDKNYDRDPDTVEYIKEAKEQGNSNYQKMYDEYLQPREMNFHFKVVIHEDGAITLYSNISPKGVEWEETTMSDFILN
jgi:hypothetical protein